MKKALFVRIAVAVFGLGMFFTACVGAVRQQYYEEVSETERFLNSVRELSPLAKNRDDVIGTLLEGRRLLAAAERDGEEKRWKEGTQKALESREKLTDFARLVIDEILLDTTEDLIRKRQMLDDQDPLKDDIPELKRLLATSRQLGGKLAKDGETGAEPPSVDSETLQEIVNLHQQLDAFVNKKSERFIVLTSEPPEKTTEPAAEPAAPESTSPRIVTREGVHDFVVNFGLSEYTLNADGREAVAGIHAFVLEKIRSQMTDPAVVNVDIVEIKVVGYTDSVGFNPNGDLHRKFTGMLKAIGKPIPQDPIERRKRFNRLLSKLRAESICRQLEIVIRRHQGENIREPLAKNCTGEGETIPEYVVNPKERDPRRRSCQIFFILRTRKSFGSLDADATAP